MVKKYVLVGAIAAFLAAANLAHAPTRIPVYFNPSPSTITINKENFLEKYAKDNEEKLKELIRKQEMSKQEQELLKNDKIYRKIDSFYKTVNPPRYITKKFIRSLGLIESEDFPRAKSRAGARGWGQLMEDAWYKVDKSNYKKNAFNLEKNIEVTIKYLLWTENQLKRLHPNWDKVTDEEKIKLIAAAYNGGVWGLFRSGWDINKMPEETQEYIPKLEKVSKMIIPSAKIYE